MDSKKPNKNRAEKSGISASKGGRKAHSGTYRKASHRFADLPECKNLPGAGGKIKWFDYQMIGGFVIFAEHGGHRAEVRASHCVGCHPDRKLTYGFSISDLNTSKIVAGKGHAPSLEQAVRAAEEGLHKLL